MTWEQTRHTLLGRPKISQSRPAVLRSQTAVQKRERRRRHAVKSQPGRESWCLKEKLNWAENDEERIHRDDLPAWLCPHWDPNVLSNVSSIILSSYSLLVHQLISQNPRVSFDFVQHSNRQNTEALIRKTHRTSPHVEMYRIIISTVYSE